MRDRSDRGSAAVEFALVLPILLMLALAVVQVGLFVRDDLVLVGSARAGVRQAAVSADDDSVRTAVSQGAPGLDPTRIDVTISRTHRGAEKGMTPGGAHVRNVAQHVIGAAYAVYCFGDGDQLLTGEFAALQPAAH